MKEPAQCPEHRPPTRMEALRFVLLGRIRGFDIPYETRCHRYAGHGEFPNQVEHRDVAGREWM